ncbi:MAG: hypothetical protein Q9213_002090 [Squamulea squamosa]
MRSSICILLANLLTTLALPTTQPNSNLTITTYSSTSCGGRSKNYPNIEYFYHVHNNDCTESCDPIVSYRLSRDLLPAERLMFMNGMLEAPERADTKEEPWRAHAWGRASWDVKWDGKKEGCHDLGFEAENFVLMSEEGRFEVDDGGPGNLRSMEAL